MLDPAHLTLWAWDARPYPYFPDLTDVWSDGANWERGHWLNGRLGQATLAGIIESVLRDHDFSDYAIDEVYALVGGYVVNDVLSARGTLEPLLQAFRVNASDAGETRALPRPGAAGRCRARSRRRWSSATASRSSDGGARRRRNSRRSWCCASSIRARIISFRPLRRGGSRVEAGAPARST